MTLETKYDAFYASNAAPGALPELPLRGWPRNRTEAILAMPLQGEAVLDVGCGDGLLLYQLRRRFRHLVGLEYSPVRLDAARANLGGLSFRGLCGSAEAMRGIDAASIDCIVSADVIEHVPDVYAAAGEMFRVLRPGGILAINTPNVAFAVKRLKLLAGRFPSTSQPNEGLGSDVLFDGGHLHYFSFRSLRLLLERAGFEMLRPVGYGPLGRLHHLHPGLLSVGVQWLARRGT